MTSMTLDYPARLVYTSPRGQPLLMGTTQACIMKEIMCSGLTTVGAYRTKDTATSEAVVLCRKNTEITLVAYLKLTKHSVISAGDTNPTRLY